MNRTVAHMDLDTFFVSVERLQNSKLNNMPVIIGGTSDRGVVSSCSYEARHFGVRSGMPMRRAKMLCPNANYVRGDMDSYSRYSNMVTDIISEKAPLYEKASIDEHYIDLTGMDRFYGCMQWTQELRQSIIKNTGLPISFGLSINKTISKIATGEAKPSGELEVPQQGVLPFMHPLSIKKIPMLGPKTYQLLRSMGIVTIGTLSQIPPEMMESVLGKNGRSIWQKANGVDYTPVMRYSEQKSMSHERTFEQDSTDVRRMTDMLTGMAEQLAFQLRKQQKLASCVTVKVRYSNFDTHTLQKRIPYTSFDHDLIKVTKELFAKVYQRRMLIRLIGVKLSHIVSGTQQLNLFEDTPEMVRLYQSMDYIRKRFGKKAIRRSVTLLDKPGEKKSHKKVLKRGNPPTKTSTL